MSHNETYQAALNALMRETPTTVEASTAINAAIAELLKVCSLSGQVPFAHAPAAISGKRIYDGLSVSEAAVKYLKTLPPKQSQKAMRIVKALMEAGYEFEAAKPEIALATALKRRAKNYGDILRVDQGAWGLRDWYSQRELTAFNHKERTRAGLKAAKARGVKIGSGWKIGEKQAVEFKRMIADGEKSSTIQKTFGISGGTFYNYKKKLESWNPGDPYPPESKSDDDGEPPSLRVVSLE